MTRVFGVTANYTLIAIPLFVFMGVMLEKSRLADDLFDRGYEFDFFQAVWLLERMDAKRRPVGYDGSPGGESVRVAIRPATRPRVSTRPRSGCSAQRRSSGRRR